MLSNLKYRDLSVVSLRKQPTFRDATTGFPAKWRLRNERRNSILMTRHYPDLGIASDWLNQISHAARPIRSTTQIAKSRLFSQASLWWAGQLFAEGEKIIILDSGFYVLDSGLPTTENWDSGFQQIAEFRISKPSISGFHKQKLPRLGFGKQKFPGFWNPDYITCGNGRNKAPECWVCLSYIKCFRSVISNPRISNTVRHSTAKITESMAITKYYYRIFKKVIDFKAVFSLSYLFLGVQPLWTWQRSVLCGTGLLTLFSVYLELANN